MVLALGAVLFGGVDLIWHNANHWHRIPPLSFGPVAAVQALFLLVAGVQLAGGLALLWPRPQATTPRAGAWAVAAAYLVITLLTLPGLVLQPGIFNSWNYTCMQLARLTGAAVLLAMLTSSAAEQTRAGWLGPAAGRIFGVCSISFMVEQWIYFPPTVALVPKWLPPSPAFWAVATTAAFGLAGIALLTGRWALVASRLLTAMLVGFGLLVWLPLLALQPHVMSHWVEASSTLSIAGAAWVISDYLDGATTRAAR